MSGSVSAEVREVELPSLGESVAEATILAVTVAPGDAIAAGDPLVEVSTDKVDVEVPSPLGGTVVELLVAEGDAVPIGAPLVRVDVSGAGGGAAPAEAADAQPDAADVPAPVAPAPAAPAPGDADTPITPVAARVAAAHGVEAGAVEGSGRGGKVTKDDVVRHVAAGANGGTAEPVETAMRGGEAALVRYMQESRSVPTATTMRMVGAGALVARRGQLKAAGQKLSYTHIVAWALVRAVDAVPAMVHRFVERDGRPTRVDDRAVNLGVAIDVERKDGTRTVLVPVLKGADRLSFAAFVAAYDDLVARGRAGALDASELGGANLTLTNTGGFGSTTGMPRLLAGQSAIIAAGAIEVPVGFRHVAEELGIEPTMWMASTYDHRVIQGADSGRFLGAIDGLLQGGDGFYEDLFAQLGVPLPPMPVPRRLQLAAAGDGAGNGASNGAGHGAEATARDAIAAAGLLAALRAHGHRAAHLDPLSPAPEPPAPLTPAGHGLTAEALRALPARLLGEQLAAHGDAGTALERLRAAYCSTIGFEFEHLADAERVAWWRAQVEGAADEAGLAGPDARRVLRRLVEVDDFERHLQRTWLGQKTLSVEGLDVTVPMVEELVRLAAGDGDAELVVGMAHRGRLALLTHVVGMPLERLFREFDGYLDANVVSPMGTTGDVKQHLGAQGRYAREDGAEIAVRLQPNPSHLEFVSPVALGVARALRAADAQDRPVRTVLLHGDASFPAQGVVAETFNLAALPAYDVGGTVHIVQNNQIGFTTLPHDGRGHHHPTDAARSASVPVLHVNGEDVDACLRAARLAHAYRVRFGGDVILDVVGYRRLGHNETDEPAFTQPQMYERIRARQRLVERYAQDLVAAGVVSDAELKEWRAASRRRLADAVQAARAADGTPSRQTAGVEAAPALTADEATLVALNAELHALPEGFTPHPKLATLLTRRREAFAAASEPGIEWGHAEALALAVAARAGWHVRLSGEDTQRGAFTQRHLVLHDVQDGSSHLPLAQLARQGGRVEVVNSPLSEQAPVGYEWGFSATHPRALVLWEAQFGDFANVAQALVDNFVSAAHAKWGIDSSLVMLLPHGYEGAGPEHSSARLERYLALSAEDGLRVAYPTTAAQHYHLLLRQATSRRPLVVMTPKSLLRAPQAAATPAQLIAGRFEPVLVDGDPATAKRLVLCSGKVGHDLLGAEQAADARLAVVRVEQLAPFPADALRDVLAACGALREVVWVQEEPRNMGAWAYVAQHLPELLPGALPLRYVGRQERASPAEGYPSMHAIEQRRIVAEALELGGGGGR